MVRGLYRERWLHSLRGWAEPHLAETGTIDRMIDNSIPPTLRFLFIAQS